MAMIHSCRANFTGRFCLFVEKRIKLKPEGKKTKIKKNRGKQGRGREMSEDRELGGKVKHSKASVVSHQK